MGRCYCYLRCMYLGLITKGVSMGGGLAAVVCTVYLTGVADGLL
jgi:hypothetical protein